MMRFLYAILALSVGTGFAQSSGKADMPCDEICGRGACIYEGCEKSISCPGGACEFINCYQPECPGGACKFYSSVGPTCRGGGCSFHNLKEELDEGHCVGGGCKIHDGSSMMEVGIEEAIVNKKAAAPEPVKAAEPEPEPAVATPATVVEEAAAPAVEKSEEEPAAAAEAPAELAEAEAKPEELGEEKKSRFARYNKRT